MAVLVNTSGVNGQASDFTSVAPVSLINDLGITLAGTNSFLPIGIAPSGSPITVNVSGTAQISGSVNILNSSLPVTQSGTWTVDNTQLSPVNIALAPYAVDAFGRLRVSEVHSLFDSKQCVSNDGEVWDNVILSGVSTFSPTTSSTIMTVSGTNGAYNIRQTFQRMNYVPAKSQLIMFTATDFHAQSNVQKRIGYYNSNFTAPYETSIDGLFWESNSSPSGVSVNIGNLGVIETALQSSWNIDKFDGLGPSGKTVTDWSKNQIYFMDFEWLGVGTARFGLILDGTPYYCHAFHHANLTTGVYMSTPNHSIRYGIRSLGGTGTLTHICSSVSSETANEPRFYERSIKNGLTPVAGPLKDLDWAMLGLRIDGTGTTNAAGINIQLENIEVLTTTSNANGQWAKVLSPTIAGSVTWLPVNGASGLQYFVGSASNLTTGGTELHRGYYSNSVNQSSSDQSISQRIGIGISGNAQTLILVGNNTVNSTAMFAAMNIQVIY